MPDYGAPSIPHKQFVVAGIELDVFGLDRLPSPPSSSPSTPTPVAVAFHLHGRLNKKRSLHASVHAIFEHLGQNGDAARLPLIVVCFDQRNHGTRLVDILRNYGWRENPEEENPTHAVDMYAAQTGTAQDVSLIMDFLPAVLFPNDERFVSRWICMGVSLGGHATWIAGSTDSRITHLCPIIGSPSTTRLLKDRAQKQGLPFAPPTFPLSLQRQLDQTDPLNVPSEVWKGKYVQVISAQQDPLVPFVEGASDVMVQKLQSAGVDVQVHLEPDLGHTVNKAMVLCCAQWLASCALQP